MPDGDELRTAAVAAVIALAEKPDGPAICREIVRMAGHMRTPTEHHEAGLRAALDGLADHLAEAADHAEFLRREIIAPSPDPPP